MTTQDDSATKVPAPGRQPVEVHQSLWRHCIESCAVVVAGIWLLAVLMPRSVPMWEATGPLAALTGVTWWVTVTATRSMPISSWLLAWGAVLTTWLTAARVYGPWDKDIIGALIFAYVILTPLGPPAIGHFRTRGNRDYAAEDRARQLAELARRETMFTRMGIRGIQVTEVFRHESGLQIHGSLGKATDEHGVFTFARLNQLAAEVATHERLAADAVHFEQPDPDNAASFRHAPAYPQGPPDGQVPAGEQSPGHRQ